MSTIANWAYTQTLTFWSAALDEYGQPTYSREYTLPGAYALEEALRSDGGIPTAEASSGTDTFYFEYPGVNPPRVGWRIALGDFPDAPPASAKKIMSVKIFDVAMFGEAIPDYQVGAM